MKRARVAFIAHEGFLDFPVFDAQVLEPFKEACAHSELEPMVVAFERADRFFLNLPRVIRKRRAIRLMANRRVKVYLLPRLAGTVGMTFAGAALAVLLMGVKGPLICHCRGLKATSIARPLKRLRRRTRVIHDVRGAYPEELRYKYQREQLTERNMQGDSEEKVRRLEEIERKAARTADFHFCVSEALSEHMKKKHGLPDELIDIIPCGVSERFAFDPQARKETRGRFGWGEKVVFVYVGSMDVWQMPVRMLALFSKIRSHIPEAVLLIATYDLEKAHAYVQSLDLPIGSVLAERIPNERIPDILCAADFGFLLHEPSLQNAVRSPIKFSEYMCCGLPVIMTDVAIDATKELERSGAGVLLPAEKAESDFDYDDLCHRIAAVQLSDEERTDLSAKMRSKYLWQKLSIKQLNRYRALAGFAGTAVLQRVHLKRPG